MRFVAFDFEVANDRDKLDDTGADVFVANGKPTYLSIASSTGKAHAWRADDPKAIKTLLELAEADDTERLVAHNAVFDFLVLMHHYPLAYENLKDICRTPWACSMAAAARLNLPWALGDLGKRLNKGVKEGIDHDAPMFHSESEWLAYAKRDAELCRDVWAIVKAGMTEKELKVMDAHIRMQCEGIEVDVEAVKAGLVECKQSDEVLDGKIGKLTGGLRGSQAEKLGKWFQSKVGIKSASTKTLGAQLDKVAKDQMAHRVYDLLVERKENETAKLRKVLACQVGGTLRSTLKLNATITNRWSGDGAHPHNAKRGGRYRKAMVPRPGHEFFVADFSQIELRVALWLASMDRQLRTLHESDWYSQLAIEALGESDDPEAHKEKRRRIKQAVIGIMYAGGVETIRLSIGHDFPYAEAEELHVRVSKELQPLVDVSKAFLQAGALALRTGKPRKVACRGGEADVLFVPVRDRLEVRLPLENVRLYYHCVSPLNQDEGGWRYIQGKPGSVKHRGTAYEHVCSTIAREALAERVANFRDNVLYGSDLFRKSDARIATTIQDELLHEVEMGKVDDDTKELMGDQMLEWMRDALPEAKGLLLDAEGDWRTSWA